MNADGTCKHGFYVKNGKQECLKKKRTCKAPKKRQSEYPFECIQGDLAEVMVNKALPANIVVGVPSKKTSALAKIAALRREFNKALPANIVVGVPSKKTRALAKIADLKRELNKGLAAKMVVGKINKELPTKVVKIKKTKAKKLKVDEEPDLIPHDPVTGEELIDFDIDSDQPVQWRDKTGKVINFLNDYKEAMQELGSDEKKKKRAPKLKFNRTPDGGILKIIENDKTEELSCRSSSAPPVAQPLLQIPPPRVVHLLVAKKKVPKQVST